MSEVGDARASDGALLLAWRHPRAVGAEGRCIGARSDLRVDPRKAKRLAHRIRAQVRREALPRVVAASPLRRCRDVARWLRRFGFHCTVDGRLAECDFGDWDGRRWDAIPRDEIDAWSADLDGHRPGGGECVRELRERVAGFMRESPATMVITHGGWVCAALWLGQGGGPAQAASWPKPPAMGACSRLRRRVDRIG